MNSQFRMKKGKNEGMKIEWRYVLIVYIDLMY